MAEQETDNGRDRTETVDYVILGAGSAGIWAANTFAAQGISTTILEARNRIGGRVDTRTVSGFSTPVEMGASFVHSALISPWPSVAQEAGITLDLWNGFDILFIEDGRRLNPNAAMETLIDFSIVWEEHFTYAELGRSDAEALVLAGYTEPQPRIESVLNAVMTEPAINFEYHDSTGWNPYPDDVLGEDYIVPGGYAELLNYVFRNYSLASCDLRLRSQVTAIDYTNPQGQVLITYRNLRTGALRNIRATKGVVVTIPLGVLKSNAVTFRPPLPTTFQNSMAKASTGNAIKVALFFSDRMKRMLARDAYNWYFLVPPTNPNDRSVNMSIVFNLMHISGEPILLSFFTGDGALIMERRSDQEIINIHMRRLRTFLPRLDDPIDYIIARWSLDPFSLGCYSDYKVGTSFNDFDVFLEPIGAPNKKTIKFAGEWVGSPQVSPLLDIGTTNHASTTGKWAAEYLIDLNSA